MDLSGLPIPQKKEKLLEYGKNLVKIRGKLTLRDLEKIDVSRSLVQVLFGNFSNYKELCGIPRTSRMPGLTDEEIKEYLLQIKVVTENECWITDKLHSFRNRPRIAFRGSVVNLSRISYLLFKGPLVEQNKTLVMHLCNNPACFNPEHLKLGTAKENAEHMVISGNQKTGYSRHKVLLKDPYDYDALLAFIKKKIVISEKNEWLYTGYIPADGYPKKDINRKRYALHRLILANKLGIKYEDVEVARHVLPDGSRPKKHDLNPDHLLNGTLSDNVLDTFPYKKNALPLSKLKAIKQRFDEFTEVVNGQAGQIDLSIAAEFNISATTARKIRLGESYSWLFEKKFKALPKRVIQLTQTDVFIKEYLSANLAAKELNCSVSGITAACRGQLKHFKGYHWQYA